MAGEPRATRRLAPDREGTVPVSLSRARAAGAPLEAEDRVAREEPLEIRLAAGDERRTLAVTMRTPGADEELAAGFLFCEGLVGDRHLIAGLDAFTEEDAPEGGGAPAGRRDVVEVALRARRLPALQALERHFFTGSACGVCGRAALDERLVAGREPIAAAGPRLDPAALLALPDRLAGEQAAFAATGGVHAAALFDGTGAILSVREDVGRHNALDKLVGRALLAGELGEGRDLGHLGLLVSGRASFEIVQKALAAGLPLVCAVSAPTSLAVETAERFGITLVAFLRAGRFNVYTHPERLAGAPRG